MSFVRKAASVQYGSTSTRNTRTDITSVADGDFLFKASDPFSTSLALSRNLLTSKISNIETFIHFLKGNIGSGKSTKNSNSYKTWITVRKLKFFSGILGIPFAMSLAGIVLGPPLMFVVAMLCLYCMLMLLKCSTKLSAKTETTGLGYGDVVELAFQVAHS